MRTPDGYFLDLSARPEQQPPAAIGEKVFESFTETRSNSLGVMHKAEIINPTEKERRIVNSIMLVAVGGSSTDEVGLEQQREFVTTEKISPKVYG